MSYLEFTVLLYLIISYTTSSTRSTIPVNALDCSASSQDNDGNSAHRRVEANSSKFLIFKATKLKISGFLVFYFFFQPYGKCYIR